MVPTSWQVPDIHRRRDLLGVRLPNDSQLRDEIYYGSTEPSPVDAKVAKRISRAQRLNRNASTTFRTIEAEPKKPKIYEFGRVFPVDVDYTSIKPVPRETARNGRKIPRDGIEVEPRVYSIFPDNCTVPDCSCRGNLMPGHELTNDRDLFTDEVYTRFDGTTGTRPRGIERIYYDATLQLSPEEVEAKRGSIERKDLVWKPPPKTNDTSSQAKRSSSPSDRVGSEGKADTHVQSTTEATATNASPGTSTSGHRTPKDRPATPPPLPMDVQMIQISRKVKVPGGIPISSLLADPLDHKKMGFTRQTLSPTSAAMTLPTPPRSGDPDHQSFDQELPEKDVLGLYLIPPLSQSSRPSTPRLEPPDPMDVDHDPRGFPMIISRSATPLSTLRMDVDQERMATPRPQMGGTGPMVLDRLPESLSSAIQEVERMAARKPPTSQEEGHPNPSQPQHQSATWPSSSGSVSPLQASPLGISLGTMSPSITGHTQPNIPCALTLSLLPPEYLPEVHTPAASTSRREHVYPISTPTSSTSTLPSISTLSHQSLSPSTSSDLLQPNFQQLRNDRPHSQDLLLATPLPTSRSPSSELSDAKLAGPSTKPPVVSTPKPKPKPTRTAKPKRPQPSTSTSTSTTNSKAGAVDKPYPCKVPGCPARFTRANDVKRHMDSASAHRDFQKEAALGQSDKACPRCGRILSREDSARRHYESGACGKRELPSEQVLRGARQPGGGGGPKGGDSSSSEHRGGQTTRGSSRTR